MFRYVIILVTTQSTLIYETRDFTDRLTDCISHFLLVFSFTDHMFAITSNHNSA